jgi:SAM-dependent methyltransferase
MSAWFVDWFNSPYYHLLYNHRNDEEATVFISGILDWLQLPPQAELWDIACGKGRHAAAMHKHGYRVVGSDLSVNSIAAAKEEHYPGLEFVVHDMRLPMPHKTFDAAFNLFTSIGYFEDPSDNVSVFQAVSRSLKSNGFFVVDFFNPYRVSNCMGDTYVEKRGAIDFHITKKADGHVITKQIQFNDKGHAFAFQEVVSLLTEKDFDAFATQTGFERVALFGNYKLDDYQPAHSDRLILCYRKIK